MSAVDKKSYMKVVENRLFGVARDLAELHEKGGMVAAQAIAFILTTDRRNS